MTEKTENFNDFEWGEKVARLSVELADLSLSSKGVVRANRVQASLALDKAARHLMAAAGEEGFP